MGTREVYKEKLRRGNMYDYDPTMKPGLGSPRCPRCLSLLNPTSDKGEWIITPVLHDATVVPSSGIGGLLSAVHGFNIGIPYLQKHLKGPMWLRVVVGSHRLCCILQLELYLEVSFLSFLSRFLSLKEHTEELKLLLEQYAGLLDYPFQEAEEPAFLLVILSLNMVDWMNFAVFLNAWNLRSHELEETKPSTWNLVNSLLNMYIRAKVRSMGPLISSPRNDLPELVQLVTEPFTWHRLIIQSLNILERDSRTYNSECGSCV